MTAALPQGGIRLRRGSNAVVGRSIEIGAIEETIGEARRGIAGLSLEGEPGIGKSRLLVAAAAAAAEHGFIPVSVSADEEIRGPFMLARSLFESEALREGASDRVVAALDRAYDLLSGQDDTGLGGLPPEDRLLRVIDQATLALRTAATERPIALLLDDLQWSDQDSLRLLRYVVRTQPSLHLFFAIAIRPEESAHTNELVTLLADMDRMGIVRRLQVARFRQGETAELLRQTLGGQVAAQTVAAIQTQAEGVPFVIEELARTYRDAGLLQQVDGSWTLSAKAGRLVPSSIRTLVQRRAAHLKDDARGVLAEAALLGRSFRLSDVCAIRSELGQSDCTTEALADIVAPAVDAGLISGTAGRSGADFTFNHAQVHEFAAGWLPPARQRAVHAAIVELLSGDDQPTPGMLPVLARHALAAGDVDRAARFSIEASEAALAGHAPEEALRLIEDALGVVSARQERVALLRIRDDAFDMLRRVGDRLEGLTELAALAEAARDLDLESEVKLRRAAALRLDDQPDRAADLAREVRRMAVEQANPRRELAACIELGQDLLRSTLGEGFSPTPLEADFDSAEEAYTRAAKIAEAIGDKRNLAAVSRELGVIGIARVRAWFVERFKAGDHIDILRHVASGGKLEDVLPTMPIAPIFTEAAIQMQRALELFEELDDRRGAMSTIIALAYLSWAPDVHVGATPARRIEEIRRLATGLRSLSHESERAAADAQMLYGVHVFCRAKVIPDLAIARGREAWEGARTIGDRSLEFLASGGTAVALIEIGDLDEARRWLERAAAVASASATPPRLRQLECWRGMLAAAQGETDDLRRHVTAALEMTARQDRRAARCEILAWGALEYVRMTELASGTAEAGANLLDEAEAMALEAKGLAADLPGRAPWAAQADAALGGVAWARGDSQRALERARSALTERRDAFREDPHLEILLPAARVVLAAGDEAEAASLRDELQLLQAMIGQRTLDGEIRARWFRAPEGRALSDLAGPFEPAPRAAAGDAGNVALPADEQRLLGLLMEGRTNVEIADALATSQESVALALATMYARIGATSRAEATVLALTGAI